MIVNNNIANTKLTGLEKKALTWLDGPDFMFQDLAEGCSVRHTIAGFADVVILLIIAWHVEVPHLRFIELSHGTSRSRISASLRAG